MKTKSLRLILGGVVSVIIASGVSWLLTSESSPLDAYLLQNPSLRNFWGMLNFPSYLIGSLIAGNPHSVNELVANIVFFVQWVLIGVLVAAILDQIFKSRFVVNLFIFSLLLPISSI